MLAKSNGNISVGSRSSASMKVTRRVLLLQKPLQPCEHVRRPNSEHRNLRASIQRATHSAEHFHEEHLKSHRRAVRLLELHVARCVVGCVESCRDLLCCSLCVFFLVWFGLVCLLRCCNPRARAQTNDSIASSPNKA